jgi:hypothetical protein
VGSLEVTVSGFTLRLIAIFSLQTCLRPGEPAQFIESFIRQFIAFADDFRQIIAKSAVNI